MPHLSFLLMPRKTAVLREYGISLIFSLIFLIIEIKI